MTSLSIRRLSKAARSAGIESAAQFQSLALRLSPQQERLFTLLHDHGPCNTVVVRQQASIGNISECAKALNDKLHAAGDTRRVRCETKPHENKFGERGVLGWWCLEDKEQAAA
jgi:hypothetical protein